MSCRLVYKDIAPGAAADAQVISGDAQSFCSLAQLPVGIDVPKIATLEPDMWILGGGFKIHDNQTIPFWSESMSGADGSFSSAPSITVTFDNQYTSLGVFLRFAPCTGDYCKSVTITWYQGAAQLSQKTFAPTSTSYFCVNTVTAYDKVAISLNATSKPFRYARLEQIMFGVFRVFNADELSSVKILQEINLLSSEIAVNTLNWKLRSAEGIDYIFQLKQPVEAYNGETLVGVFYITGSKRLANKTYEITCEDALGVLDGSSFAAAIFSCKNAAALIGEIIGSDFDVEIDSSFSSATVSGYIPDCTRREALVQVCFAIGAVCDTSGSTKIRIYPAPYSNATEIPDNRVYSGGAVDTEAIVTAVKVTAHTYTAGSGSSGDDVIKIGNETYVHTTAVTTVVNPNVTANDKQNIVEISDATLVSPSNVATVAQRAYSYFTRRDTLNAKIVVTAEKPGDYVTINTPWGTAVTGSITEMTTNLSNTTAAEIKVKAVST